MDGKGETLPINSDLVGGASSLEGETLYAWHCPGEYRCRADLLMWESVPMPL